LLILSADQKQFFDKQGYLFLRGFYDSGEMEEMRRQYHELVIKTDKRPQNMSYSFMKPVAGYEPDDFNPQNVVGMMNQPLANDYWFDQFTEPRIVSVIVDLLGPNIDFHNGKIRNKPPGFTNDQGWHQDWPYELHTEPDLAAAITYLDPTDIDAGATEVIPGGHLRGPLPTAEGTSALVQEEVPSERGVALKAETGDVAIVHVLAVHQAGNNRTKRSRNAIINEYKTAETVDRWNNRCAFAGLPLARNGRLLMPRVSSTG
jgi:ectoine hydroxylase-related dioxygenase (phytanoyl-CoA dioxygenase family)